MSKQSPRKTEQPEPAEGHLCPEIKRRIEEFKWFREHHEKEELALARKRVKLAKKVTTQLVASFIGS